MQRYCQQQIDAFAATQPDDISQKTISSGTRSDAKVLQATFQQRQGQQQQQQQY